MIKEAKRILANEKLLKQKLLNLIELANIGHGRIILIFEDIIAGLQLEHNISQAIKRLRKHKS